MPEFGSVDRRKHSRRPEAMSVLIDVLGRGRIACSLVNISDGGALLKVPPSLVVPKTFGLWIGQANAAVACKLEHRNGAFIGISFEQQEGVTGAAARRAVRAACDVLNPGRT